MQTKITVAGREHMLCLVSPRHLPRATVGVCMINSPKPEPILIDRRLKGKELLDTIIHEMLHLQNPTMSEESVAEHATEIADVVLNPLIMDVVRIEWSD